MLARVVAVLLACAVVAPAYATRDGGRTEDVRFAKGASSTSVKGTIKGYESVAYRVRARAGQTLSADLKTDHNATYFNVAESETDTAIFVGSTSGKRFVGKLPTNGDYLVTVYLMRNVARRGATSHYTLTIGVR